MLHWGEYKQHRNKQVTAAGARRGTSERAGVDERHASARQPIYTQQPTAPPRVPPQQVGVGAFARADSLPAIPAPRRTASPPSTPRRSATCQTASPTWCPPARHPCWTRRWRGGALRTHSPSCSSRWRCLASATIKSPHCIMRHVCGWLRACVRACVCACVHTLGRQHPARTPCPPARPPAHSPPTHTTRAPSVPLALHAALQRRHPPGRCGCPGPHRHCGCACCGGGEPFCCELEVSALRLP